MTRLRKAIAFSVLPSNPTQVVMVEDNAPGYSPYSDPFERAIDAAAYADHMNAKLSVSPALREAYMMRSMVPVSPATEADFVNAKPLLAEFQISAAGPSILNRV